MPYLFTSESVSEGHPDKICDRISDTILDLFLTHEPEARVACETLATTNRVILAGEVRATEEILPVIMKKIEPAVRAAVKEIGYEQEKFHHAHFDFQNYLHEQSVDISQGVDADSKKDEGAGDQGLMFGYACRETESLMPAAIHYSHAILKTLALIRKQDPETILGPDAKSQLTLKYSDDGKIMGVETIVLSTQHKKDVSVEEIRGLVTPIIADILPDGWMVSKENLLVNPTGKFEIGGPDGDAGLTGRKIIVDTYGGAAPHGGGAFSGKDPTKVDRSAAYAARYLAKNIVAAGIAEKCTIQVAYAIGVSQPVSISVDTHGTSQFSSIKIENAVRQVMDLSPKGIRTHLKLNNPIYACTSAYGHFGRNFEEMGKNTFTWENVNLIESLKSAI
ncbi:MAG: methionine adenosyltransferase [Alphaproteobacteria bacterium]|jgi:S-adenosylmethionine synthetase|nr:methionine adenosyltransferase [Alphaproteobacteria bacterium]MBT5798233.1 methionine adenosyltransferase [Alphaproteobacteria bacterium]